MVKFCPKCGHILVVKEIKGKKYLTCPKCGYKEKLRSSKEVTVREKVQAERKRVVVLSKGEELSELPTTKITCPRCGYDEAYWWMQQTRAADEPPTIFYKCKKCGYVWRSYD